MRNDRYLKRLCDEQQRQIERWKRYCSKLEALLERASDYYACAVIEMSNGDEDLWEEIDSELWKETIR